MMFQIKGIVPGSVVKFKDKFNQTREGIVLLIRSEDIVVVKLAEGGTLCINKQFCTLVQPVLAGRRYNIYGELI